MSQVGSPQSQPIFQSWAVSGAPVSSITPRQWDHLGQYHSCMVLFGLATWCRLLRDGDVPSAQRNGPQSFGAIRAQEWSITTRLSAQCRFDCTLFAYQSRFRIFYLPSCGNKSGGAFDDHQHQSSHRIEDRHQWTLSPSRDLESHPRVQT